MSFSDVLNDLERNQRTNKTDMMDLPITHNQTKPAAANIMASTSNKIEQAKNDLYEKIDVCCAQYGLYGLQVISEAISNSLTQMISSMNRTVSTRQHSYAMPVEESSEPAYRPQQQMSYGQPRIGGAEAFANDFMNHLGDIFEACDKDVDRRAEEQIKARLYEQKQNEILAAQQQVNDKRQAEIDLSEHADDFELTSEENLHNV